MSNYCRVCGIGLYDGQTTCPACLDKRLKANAAPSRKSASGGGCLLLLPLAGAALAAALRGWLF